MPVGGRPVKEASFVRIEGRCGRGRPGWSLVHSFDEVVNDDQDSVLTPSYRSWSVMRDTRTYL